MEDKKIFYNLIMTMTDKISCPSIKDDTDIYEDLGFDSLAVISLLEAIESQYGIDFTTLPDFLERFECVGDIWNGIQILLENQSI